MSRRRKSEPLGCGGIIATIIVGMIVLALASMTIPVIVLVAVIVGIVYLVYYIYLYTKKRKVQHQDQIAEVSLSEVDRLDGWAFEKFVAELLRQQNYSNVVVTKGSGDFGVDITAEKDNRKWVFQCKHYNSNLGIKPIQEAYTGAAKYDADIAVVVTNSYFTDHAKNMARSLNVKLWDREYLKTLMPLQPTIFDRNTEVEAETAPALEPIPVDDEFDDKLAEAQEPELVLEGDTGDADSQSPAVEATPVVESNEAETEENKPMATVIGAGKYIFGEDVPLGKYNLKVISGNGIFQIQVNNNPNNDEWFYMGTKEDRAHEYHGLSLPEGKYFTINGDLRLEIRKTKMLEIEDD